MTSDEPPSSTADTAGPASAAARPSRVEAGGASSRAASARLDEARKTVVSGADPLSATAADSSRVSADDGADLVVELRGDHLDRHLREAGCSAGDGARRYQLQQMLGMGATGRVFSVVDHNLQREIAVKVQSQTATAANAEEVGSFIQEARITASLQHPNVLPVHEIDVTPQGHFYFTMNKIAGLSLGDAISQSSPDARDAKIGSFNAVVSVFISVCNAIAYAHHKDIVHQDIKPDNILLGNFGEVLVLDWGSAARMHGDGEKDGQGVRLYGTPIYMSPEQARREGVTPLSDVYCLGGTLFHALTLRYPTWSDEAERFWTMKKCGDIDAPTVEERRDVPPALLDIALKALEAKPERRYQSVDAMRDDLERYQAGLAVSAHRESLLRMLARWYARNAKLFWVSATALALILTVASVLWREKMKEQQVWKLVSEEDFEHTTLPALAKDWTVQTRQVFGPGTYDQVAMDAGNFLIEEGRLKATSKGEIMDLVSTRKIPGNVRIEWDYRTLAGVNLNCFLGDNRTDGFTFHIAAWGDNTYMVMTKGEAYLIVDMFVAEQPLELKRTYHFSMERNDQHARLSIDGRKVLEYMDLEDALPQSFGFDCFSGSDWTIDNIRIYHQPLPQKISPLAVADKLYQTKNFPEAKRQYEEILSAYPGSELARTAHFWLGMCAIRTGDADRGLSLLADFESMNPDHELVPFSLHERLKLAHASGDLPREERIRLALARFPGNPIAWTVLRELGEERLAMLKPRNITGPGAHCYPDDIVARIEATHRELKRWSEAYHTPWQTNPFMHESSVLLMRYGRFDDILSTFPPHSRERGEAYANMGRYDLIKDDFITNYGLHARVDHDQISYDDLASGTIDSDPNWMLFILGKFDELMQKGAQSWQGQLTMLNTGHAEDVLKLVPSSPRENSFDTSQRMRAWLVLGKPEKVLEESTSRSVRAAAYIAMRRYDEALAEAPESIPSGYTVAMHLLIDGELARGRELFAKLADAEPDCLDDQRIFCQHLLPLLMIAIDGDRAAAKRKLAEIATRNRYSYRQQLWYIAQRALGAMNDEEFLAQPYRNYREDRLLLAKLIEAELTGDASASIAACRACIDEPFNRHDTRDIQDLYMEWRLRQLTPGKR